MKWSIVLGRVAGVRIQIHWTFLILIAWITIAEVNKGSDLGKVLLTVGFILTIFLCVLLHEFGHILMARRFGIDTKKITLLPIGGVASLEKLPEEPKHELLVALAGPAVNVAIAFLVFLFIPNKEIFTETNLSNIGSGEAFLASLLSVNIILVIFNLIPAFPMDGGRVLRALLAMKIDRVKATRIASNIGQFLAIGFVFVGLFFNPFLVFIGIFIFFGAYTENLMIQHLEYLKGHTVKDAMMTHYSTLAPGETAKEAVDKLLAGSDHDFIVEEDGEVKGIVTRDILISTVKEKGLGTPIVYFMRKDFEWINANERLTEVFAKIQKHKNSFFPVMDGRKIIGVINPENINEFIMIQSALSY